MFAEFLNAKGTYLINFKLWNKFEYVCQAIWSEQKLDLYLTINSSHALFTYNFNFEVFSFDEKLGFYVVINRTSHPKDQCIPASSCYLIDEIAISLALK